MQVVDSEGYLKVKLVGGPVGPFVPYTGATANVNLGEYEIKAGQFTLDTSPTGTAVVGTTRWNDSIGSSETTLKGGSVILKNGVDLVARVVNKVTPNATLTKANYTAVRISGAQGQRLAVAYAQANNDANSADTIGLVAETIPTNQEGFIITVGNLEGVNTTGALQGEIWADGDVLYLSPTTPGAITNIKPNGSTGHIIVIGYVEYAHAINGKIYVKIMNGWELDELHNVYINPATLANNNILQYDSADQLWKNKVISTGITIGSTAIASGTVGRILFEGAGNVVQESANLFWDNTNGRLGIGTSSPAEKLDVNGSIRLTNTLGTNRSTLLTTVSSSDNLSSITFYPATGTNVCQALDIMPKGSGIAGQMAQFSIWGTDFIANSTNYELLLMRATSTSYTFQSFKGGTGQHRPILFSAGISNQFWAYTSGNIGINTTTDAGFRLDVNGTARVSGALTTSAGIISNGTVRVTATTASPSGNASFFVFDGAEGTNFAYDYGTSTYRALAYNGSLVRFLTAGTERARFAITTGNFLINTTTDAGFRLDVNGTARVNGVFSVGADTARIDLWRSSGAFGGRIGTGYSNPAVNHVYIQCDTNSKAILIDDSNRTLFSSSNGDTTTASAQVTINSTTRGFLPPRMTTTQKNAIASPAAGLMVYDTTLNVISYYNGSMWI